MKLRQQQKHKLEILLDEAETIVDDLQVGSLNEIERVEAWAKLEAILKIIKVEIKNEQKI
jgi:hypothetical protein